MAFATAEDVATRLGRELTEFEDSSAELLLDVATGVIAQAADKTDAWADALSPVPKILKVVAIELVVRAMSNPDGVRSMQEQLGQYSRSTSYRDNGGGLLLTDAEEALVRRTVYGVSSGSSRPLSTIDELDILYYS